MKHILLFILMLSVASTALANVRQTLTRKVDLPNNRVAFVYNHGAKIEIKTKNGELQQTACFDECGIPFEQAKAFLNKLKSAIKRNDRAAVADMMEYPLQVNGAAFKINTEKDLKENYTKIFTQNMKLMVLNQSPFALFANMQGITIGDGEIWFNLHNSKMSITTINLPH